MNEAGDRAQPGDGARRLADAIREVKNAAADREDVVVDMREAQRMRLELIAAELAPVFAEVPADVDIFDFAISSGLQPRLWIDAVSHVAMGRDKRSYRFVQDTRFGRIVLAESHDVPTIVDAVTDYIARRMIEREHAMVVTPAPAADAAPASNRRARLWTFAFGFIAGIAALFGFALVMALRGI
jgi:hypothetical protein